MAVARTRKCIVTILNLMLGGVATLIMVAVVFLQNRPDLKLWHDVHLDAEFTADSPVSDFAGYLALEEKVFAQLERQVLDRLPEADREPINRYMRGSLTDPGRWARNWNRTFELTEPVPTAGVLLLHGMSDAPYSLRQLGIDLNAKGALVVGLRLPGHGTIPSGLVHLKWQDMAAAVRLAMRHLKAQLGEKPIYIIGYSTGGTLALQYALDQLADNDLPAVKKIVLISPAIGVNRLAALSVWQSRLGRWLGLDKLAWNSIQPEYNTYKYSSFAINAGDQVYRLAATVQNQIGIARQSGMLKGLPDLLTFQSVVDATVSTPAVFTGLYHHLDNPDNALILFDINRRAPIQGLLASDPLDRIRELGSASQMNCRFHLITNENPSSLSVVAVPSMDGIPGPSLLPLNLQWPHNVHSLSHIALPFPENDPLYGTVDNGNSPGILLSRIILRGERGVIQVPADEILRLRWNPFYSYLNHEVNIFFELDSSSSSTSDEPDNRPLARK